MSLLRIARSLRNPIRRPFAGLRTVFRPFSAAAAGNTSGHGVGEEFNEATHPNWFDRRPLTGPFGTMENPVLVPSVKEMRVVGCLGQQGVNEHGLLWFPVYRGRKHCCSRCGQVFLLDGEQEAEHHH